MYLELHLPQTPCSFPSKVIEAMFLHFLKKNGRIQNFIGILGCHGNKMTNGLHVLSRCISNKLTIWEQIHSLQTCLLSRDTVCFY